MKKILFILLVVFILLSCSSNKIDRNLPVAKKMQIANELYDTKKYHKAIPYYTDVVLERNSAFTAEAQMKLADCYFLQNKFLDARFEYEEMIRLFKNYEKIADAYFRIGVCYYEQSLNAHYTQEETYKAIDAFQTFLDKFPLSDKRQEAVDYIEKCQYKLLEKKLYNGYAYYKIYDYSAALMYFDEIIELKMTDKIDKMALYYSARIYLRRNDRQNVDLILEKMKNKYPESKEIIKIENMINSMN
ncbi:MAG: outer membrane protein assembly factor BamD [Candidatus Cloacimonetes bacterium]|nr:outer membrane protein assembly factor BamD [Candidatus Cloacimonadota bacterium]